MAFKIAFPISILLSLLTATPLLNKSGLYMEIHYLKT